MPDTASPSPAAFPTRLLIAGAGRMGGALLQGWLARGLDPARVAIIEPHPSAALHDLVRTHDLALNPRGPTEPAEALVLGIKPQMLGDVARQLAPHIGPDTLLVSILAGKTVADLARALPGPRAIVRAMPNLPAAIGRGATGAYATPDTSPAQREAAHALLSATGLVAWVEREELIDAVTALSGSGPAYLFYLVESLAAAGVAAGLDAPLAEALARATVTGAAALLDETGRDPAELRRDVTSPGGTTAAALAVLMGERGLGPLLREAVAAAKRRAGELSG